MVDVKSFASEATNTLSSVFMGNVEKGAEIVENRFRDPSIDKDLMQKRTESRLITYEDAIKMLTYVNIEDGYKTLNDKMYPFFYRLFDLNIQEKAETLRLLGNDSVFYGDSDLITPLAATPKYAEGVTYSEFMKNAKISERNGQISTMYDTVTNSNFYNKGQLYKKTVNLYPDENDTGLHGESDYEFDKWDANDPNSILFKTKNLFRQRKINTLISRFGTHADEGGGTLEYNGENGDPLYGESRGRNLLTKDAEQHGGYYRVNGYNNPYCRVWTHHYQYGKYVNTIRPFIDETDKAVTNEEFHKWPQFEIDDGIIACDNPKKKPWGWKNGNPNWDKSVLDKETGMVNFTPIYRDPGKDANIHTKDCMFSIENLAWKDFDPYSFERALSWEQRGPNGGRIMWFPPYGISFNESVTTEWTENKFIGRGESVFSYANTKRSGTLDFLMVVDHPSVVDYALWNSDSDENVTDTDFLRFFAGCDSETVINAAKPTPLTDEYLNFAADDNLITTGELKSVREPKTLKIKSKLFFPNNYSGLWDIKVFNSNPLGYLFFGSAADVNIEDKTWYFYRYPFGGGNIEGFWKPLALTSLDSDLDYNCYGYEICSGPGISYNGDNPFKENALYMDDETFLTKDDGKFAKKSTNKCYYRIDGIPQRPKEGSMQFTLKTIDMTYPEYDTSKGGLKTHNFLKKENTENVNVELVGKRPGGGYSSENLFDVLEEGLVNDYAMNTYGQKLGKNDYFDKVSNSRNSVYGKGGYDYIPFTVFSSICAYDGEDDGVITMNAALYEDGEETVTKGITLRKKDIIDRLVSTNNAGTGLDENMDFKTFYKLFITENKKNVKKIKFTIKGSASLDGGKKGDKNKEVDSKREERNFYLASARAQSVYEIMKEFGYGSTEKSGIDVEFVREQRYVSQSATADSNSDSSKNERYCEVIMDIEYDDVSDKYVNTNDEGEEMEPISVDEHNNFVLGYRKTREYVNGNGDIMVSERGSIPIYSDENEIKLVEYSKGKWTTLDKYIAMCKMKQDEGRMNNNIYTRAMGKRDNTAVNKIRYDQEYYFFKKLKQENPLVFERLVDKLQYFDPAFHTMTPEGFNARLTFLHQCTRQGDTTTASDPNSTSANNLAFGRPPFCVLRLGDFYKQMIVIRSINLDYKVSEDITWDLNQEGIGVQPLLCRVGITFDFIGGGDLAGPVRRLQNAMSFNYYANTSLYDNRADRPFYDWDPVTGKSVLDKDKSYAHSVTKDYGHAFAGNIAENEYVSGLSEEALDARTNAKKREDVLKEEEADKKKPTRYGK